MYRVFIPTLALAVGCGGGISEEEASTVFTGVWLVTNDVQVQAYTAIGTAGTGKGLTVEVTDGSYTFSGDLSGSGLWTGTITVTGSATWSSTAYSFDLSLEYVDVNTATPDLTMNGTVDMLVEVEYTDTSYHYEYAMAGELDVDGETSGTADFDFSMVVDYDFTTGSYTYEANGDINGHDVGGMTGGLSGSYAL